MNKLIYTDRYYLIVYEDKDVGAGTTGDAASLDKITAAETVACWSETFECHVWYSEPEDVFLVLEEDVRNDLLKVLHGDKVGWIFNFDWLELKELRHE